MKTYLNYTSLAVYLNDMNLRLAAFPTEKEEFFLMQHFAQHDYKSAYKHTPIQWCVQYGYASLAKELLLIDPHANQEKDQNNNPLWFDLFYGLPFAPHYSFIETFHGVFDFSQKTKNNDNPLHVLLESWNTASFNNIVFYEVTFLGFLKDYSKQFTNHHGVKIDTFLIEKNNTGVRVIDLIANKKTTNTQFEYYISLAQTILQKERLQHILKDNTDSLKNHEKRKI